MDPKLKQPESLKARTSKGESSSMAGSSDARGEAASNVIDRVKLLIESCLLSYMTKEQVVEKLQQEEDVPPAITIEVWKRLERENRNFFIEYRLRLMLIEQIKMYNHLLECQHRLTMAGAEAGAAQPPAPTALNNNMSPPMTGMFQNAANQLDTMLPTLQQNVMPTMDEPYPNHMGSSLSGYHGVDGMPAANSFYPNEMPYNNHTTPASILDMPAGPEPLSSLTMNPAAMASAENFHSNQYNMPGIQASSNQYNMPGIQASSNQYNMPGIQASSNQAAIQNGAHTTELQARMEGRPVNLFSTNISPEEFARIFSFTDLGDFNL